MKKIMEQFMQESAEVGHIGNLEQLEQPKIDPKEVVTFHSGEQNKLEDVIENIELETIPPIENHPPKL